MFPYIKHSNRVMKILINYIVAVNFCYICDSLEGPLHSVCKNKNEKLYCCYSYGEDNGLCIKCGNGTESKRGGPCLPCSSKMYGENCANDCSCTAYERCDRVTGNCHRNTSTTQRMLSYTVDFMKSLEYKKQTSSSLYQIAHTSQDKTTIVLGLSKRGVVVYIISIVGILMILLILYICRHFKRKKQMATISHNTIPQHEEIAEIDIHNVEGIYDLIDENLVDDSFINQHGISTNPYLEVIGSSDSDSCSDCTNDSSESSVESKRDADNRDNLTSYLNAYQPLADHWSNTNHVYDHMGVDMIVDSEQCPQNCKTSSFITQGRPCFHIDNTKEKQKVITASLLTNEKHKLRSSSSLYMNRSEEIEAALVIYRRRSF